MSLTDRFLDPEWWLGAFLMGIVINLVAAYLKTPLDQIAAAVSRRWANRSLERRRQREQRISALRADAALRLHLRLRAVSDRIKLLTATIQMLASFGLAAFIHSFSYGPVARIFFAIFTCYGLGNALYLIRRSQRTIELEAELDAADSSTRP